MRSAEFAVLAERLPFYGGAVRGALTADVAAEEDAAGSPEPAEVPGRQGESFEARMARARPVPAGAAGEAQIAGLMAGG